MADEKESFENGFLDRYMQFGLGSMPKSDIDALVMYLLDKHGYQNSGALSKYSNQGVSQLLKTPVTKVKKLRYEGALKFGERVEDEARGRLLAALHNATLEADGSKIRLIIEDALAKNWLQGQLKIHQVIFDYSFNTEIVKVDADDLFSVLDVLFDNDALDRLRRTHQKAVKLENAERRKELFASGIKKFTEGAAKAAGGGVVTALKAHLLNW